MYSIIKTYRCNKAELSNRWLKLYSPTCKLPGPFLSKVPFNQCGIFPIILPEIGSITSFLQDLIHTDESQFGK